jgi:hypothetical protein
MTEDNSGNVETDDTLNNQGTVEENQITAPETPEEQTSETNEPIEEPKKQDDTPPPWLKTRLEREHKKQAKLERELEDLRRTVEESRRPAEPALTRDDFGDDFEGWQRHVAQDEFTRLQSVKDEEQRQRQEAYAQQEQWQKEWKAKVDKFAEVAPDYGEAVQPLNSLLNEEAQIDLITSDVGPEITYHLAKNEEEAIRFDSMDQRGRDRYLAKMEAILEMKRDIKPAPTQTTPVSNAPAPLTRQEGSNNHSTTISLEDWVAQQDRDERASGRYNY